MTLLSEAHMQTEIRFVMSFVGGCVGGEEISFVFLELQLAKVRMLNFSFDLKSVTKYDTV